MACRLQPFRAACLILWLSCCGIPQPSEAGASAYVMLEELAGELDDGCFIEIGSDRGEGSTKFLSDLANVKGYENALATCGSCAYQDMGERWLGMSFEAVSNDNYDWTYPWTTESQEIHLQQAILVERLCSERCFILFDDTWPSASLKHHSGKGGRALSFLLSHGFEIIQQSAPNELSYLGYVLVLTMDVRLSGVRAGEHSLVFYDEMVMRGGRKP
ncbi:hypothetical protein GUITHDRAFT_161191 [Guillardia theta CCMP2712]|uniref:Methyltransferase domain-containing protein n=1 Tax=Guillardia theta (strain CCMP2712) TaxID=905079 RepID=L1JW63_GUITC|nr:hypothetical protein GUITHDRAFT_161191 [Guillardia theta CCMP2712]EKX52445.1 hypothetical protein GUITHDRAFT_161191 [Guillardia theta CCMP2712]|eukprot:XP_005839425.1 hypothetical protein GUITHDRAFT_161191 [Guillardia theta CCMP2712]